MEHIIAVGKNCGSKCHSKLALYCSENTEITVFLLLLNKLDYIKKMQKCQFGTTYETTFLPNVIPDEVQKDFCVKSYESDSFLIC